MSGVLRTGVKQVQLRELPVPQLEPGTAVVRVRAAGICGSDLHPYRHDAQPAQQPAGHEVAGEVVAVSPHPAATADPTIREGDRVALDTICLGRACGDATACEWCRRGLFFHCERKRRGLDWMGGFAGYIKRDVRGLFPLPASVSWEAGALVEPLAVGVHAVRQAHLRPGESVAVIGAGTIGLACLLAARGLSAGDIFVLARYPHQIALAGQLGATRVFDGSAEAALDGIRAATGGRGVDLVLESVGGDPAIFTQASHLLARRGRLALLGLFGQPGTVDVRSAHGKEATVLFPTCYGAQDGRHDYEVAIDLIASSAAPVERLLTHRFPLQAAADAFATADDKRSGAVKVQFVAEE